MENTAEKEKLVGVLARVTPEEREKAQKKAKETGLSLYAVLRKLMNDWADDNQLKLSF